MKDDPMENHTTASNGTPEPDSQPDSDPGSMEDTVEFRLMMAYAQRRRPRKEPQTNGHQTTPALMETQTDGKQEEKKKKKKKKFGRRLLSVFKCIKPQTDASEAAQPAAGSHDAVDRCFVPVPHGELQLTATRGKHSANDKLRFLFRNKSENRKEKDV